jgi:hypothetical protein
MKDIYLALLRLLVRFRAEHREGGYATQSLRYPPSLFSLTLLHQLRQWSPLLDSSNIDVDGEYDQATRLICLFNNTA